MTTNDQQLRIALDHHRAGRFAEAEPIYRALISANPSHAPTLHYLGVLAGQTDRAVEGETLIRRAIDLDPSIADFHVNLALLLLMRGNAACAEQSARQALALTPDNLAALNLLGAALKELGRREEAVECCRRMLQLNPNLPEAHANLGIALAEMGRNAAAIEPLVRAVQLRPDYLPALNLLAMLMRWRGDVEQAIQCYRQGLNYHPDSWLLHSNLLLSLNGLLESDSGLLDSHAAWGQRHAAPFYPQSPKFQNDRSLERRLRIGYVSPDFRRHAVASFLWPVLEAHNKRHVEIFCYSNVPAPDDMTRQMQRHADHWRDISAVSDEVAAKMVCDDRIDILVDLAGHTSGHRLLLFARKPAPVQMTYLGYPNTTGVRTIDYRLTDAYADPPGMTENHHTEKLLRLTGGFLCYRAPEDAPPVRERAVNDNAPVTFGTFNNYWKITQEISRLWADILIAAPQSRLLLKSESLSEPAVAQAVQDRFAALGVGPERIELLGFQQSLADHFLTYSRIDVALDTFPYHGTTTTCDALWMEVPVVTLAGHAHVSRVGVSLLKQVGLGELIASTTAEYVAIATSLACGADRRRGLSRGLRERLRHSPLGDASRLAGELEQAYQASWREWCDRA